MRFLKKLQNLSNSKSNYILSLKLLILVFCYVDFLSFLTSVTGWFFFNDKKMVLKKHCMRQREARIFWIINNRLVGRTCGISLGTILQQRIYTWKLENWNIVVPFHLSRAHIYPHAHFFNGESNKKIVKFPIV